jgi:N-acetylglucosaminyl-diphospho-decaprenol L-rhamnosyltransferase
MPSAAVAVVTLAHGRRAHLAAQIESMAAQYHPPDRYVIVDLGGPPVDVVHRHSDTEVAIVPLPSDPACLPLAAARNLGAAVGDAAVTVFLDVDCVAPPSAIGSYRSAIVEAPDAIHCGPVGYLPTGARPELGFEELRRVATFHDGRPHPEGACGRSAYYDLFWSLSFAVTRPVWSALGGFDERYRGYGAEDTDLAMTARRRGIPLWFHAHPVVFHLHHGDAGPPHDRLDSICRNAERFYAKWGSWPMTGWLRRFEQEGSIVWRPLAGTVEPVATLPPE